MSEQELPLGDERAQAESTAMLRALREARDETGDRYGRVDSIVLGHLAYHLAKTPEGRTWWDDALRYAVEFIREQDGSPEVER